MPCCMKIGALTCFRPLCSRVSIHVPPIYDPFPSRGITAVYGCLACCCTSGTASQHNGEDLVISAEDGADSSNVMGTTPQSTPRTSYSRCLEHDGQLFSIQVVPPPDPRAAPHGDPPTSPTANTPAHKTPTTPTSPAPKENRTVSAACHLEDRRLDFTGYGDPFVTPLHRWFGLKQYVLLRALGQGGLPGMGLDQLLWAMTLAAGNCKCSVPVLVSCDWDGLVEEEAGGGGASGQSGASCRGYSAPGSKGVACSVRFQTAWTEKVRIAHVVNRCWGRLKEYAMPEIGAEQGGMNWSSSP